MIYKNEILNCYKGDYQSKIPVYKNSLCLQNFEVNFSLPESYSISKYADLDEDGFTIFAEFYALINNLTYFKFSINDEPKIESNNRVNSEEKQSNQEKKEKNSSNANSVEMILTRFNKYIHSGHKQEYLFNFLNNTLLDVNYIKVEVISDFFNLCFPEFSLEELRKIKNRIIFKFYSVDNQNKTISIENYRQFLSKLGLTQVN